MSSNVNIPPSTSISAPTPQNTPLTAAPITQQLSRPTVPDIQEGGEDDGDDELPSPTPARTGGVGTAGISGLGPQQQAILTQLVQGKLSTLVGKSSGYIESLPLEVKRNVEALKGVQIQYTKLQMDHKKEVLELERKVCGDTDLRFIIPFLCSPSFQYLALYTPLFDRRLQITLGHSTPTQEEIAAGEAQSLKDDPSHPRLPLSPLSPSSPISSSVTAANPGPGIPQFWLTALRNHVGISDLITERDSEALKHLTDIRVTYIPDDGDKSGADPSSLGFKLTFYFSPNEFFTNKELTKTYIYRNELGYEGDFVYDRALGVEIHWKEDKDLTKNFEIKKQRNKSKRRRRCSFSIYCSSKHANIDTNRTRLIRKAHPTESFFNFFAPPVPPAEDALENGDVDEEELEDLEERLELDYQIGEDLKERVR